jgi:hypothetical protein
MSPPRPVVTPGEQQAGAPACLWGAGGDNAPTHTHTFFTFYSTVLTSSNPLLFGKLYYSMRWRFALLLGLAAASVPVLAAQSQCRLVLSSAILRPTPVPSVTSQGSHSPSPAPASVSRSSAPTPTPTPFVPFAYGSAPIRGVNLYVLFPCWPHALESHLTFLLAAEAGLFSR